MGWFLLCCYCRLLKFCYSVSLKQRLMALLTCIFHNCEFEFFFIFCYLLWIVTFFDFLFRLLVHFHFLFQFPTLSTLDQNTTDGFSIQQSSWCSFSFGWRAIDVSALLWSRLFAWVNPTGLWLHWSESNFVTCPRRQPTYDSVVFHTTLMMMYRNQ